MIDLKYEKADKVTETFLDDLKKSSQASGRFLEIVRPDVKKLFKDLPENRQCTLMFFLRQMVENNIDLGPELVTFQKAKQRFQYVTGLVASTLLVAHGGFGDKLIADA